jgi:hypothetical protein
MGISSTRLFVGLTPVLAALVLAVVPTMASAAAPFWYINGAKVSTTQPSVDNMKGYTISGAPVGLNETLFGQAIHTSCDATVAGRAWNDGHGAVTGATFTNCVVAAPTNCTLTLVADTATPWATQAGGDGLSAYTETISGLVAHQTFGSTAGHTCALASLGTLNVTGTLTPTVTNGTGCAGDGSDESFVTFTTTVGTLTIKDAGGTTRGSATMAGDVFECGTQQTSAPFTWSLLDLRDV